MIGIVALASIAFTPPKLVVILSIDQYRSDYLTRYDQHYLPAEKNGVVGGFRWLRANGANFVNAKYRHIPTGTGPGHAVIGTGSTPAITGIIGNDWYNRSTNKTMYCVDDAGAKDIVTGKESMSPKNLRVSTIGDELEMATNGQSITVSIAMKDRASILMAGHAADQVVWFDKKTGGWTTSDYYAKNGKLPQWAETINNQKIPDQWRGKTWSKALPPSAHARSIETKAPNTPEGFGDKFPHTMPDNDSFYDLWTFTPHGNHFVVSTAARAIAQRAMGQDSTPDLLTLNFSSNDYLGHRYGPYSPEVLEMSVETDRSVSNLLNLLRKTVPGGLASVLFVLTADHGVVPIPEDAQAFRIPAIRQMTDFDESVQTRAAKELGMQPIGEIDDGMIWLDHVALKKAGIPVERAQDLIAGYYRANLLVYRVYTQTEMGKLMAGDWLDEAARRGLDAERGCDIWVVGRPGVYDSDKKGGTGHGTAWIYDTSVPLIFAGTGFVHGRNTQDAGPDDIAATVCADLGIIPPNGSVGKAIGLKP